MYPVETQMLSALELLHYGNRFRGQLIALYLDDEIELSDIITDLRVMQAAQIKVILFCSHYPTLAAEIEEWNLRGTRMRYFQQSDEGEVSGARSGLLRDALRTEITPVIALEEPATKEPAPPPAVPTPRERQFQLLALNAAERLHASKFFIVAPVRGLEVDGVLQSHPTSAEVQALLTGSAKLNIGLEQLAFIHQQNVKRGIEIVLLEGHPGVLFQEVFSHRGKGTLFTKDYPNIVRRGRLSDVMDLAILMKPNITAGVLLPITEDEIAKEIEKFFLYTVNGAVVAASKLVDYGDSAELAKFTTLSRYQGRGRARQLAALMIEEARAQGKKFVFSLSIEPKMWQFFLGLGFVEIDRATLPEEWQKGYDLSRPSKGFRLDL